MGYVLVGGAVGGGVVGGVFGVVGALGVGGGSWVLLLLGFLLLGFHGMVVVG